MGRCSFFFSQMTKLYSNRIGVRVLELRLVDFDGFWENGTLNLDLVLGVLLDVVEEEALDAALMHDDLLEARKANDGIRDTIRATNDSIWARILVLLVSS